MGIVTRSALRVYAALTELKGDDKDVLDALIPFFEPILKVMNGKVFDPHIFSAGVRQLYRWRFTGDIASTFIPRFEKKGFLKKGPTTANGTLWIVRYEDKQTGKEEQAILDAVKSIIDEFEKFPPRVTDLLTYKKTRDELTDILIRFLVTMDSIGEGAYSHQLGELAPGGEAADLIANLEEGGRPLDDNDRYICASFVRHLLKRKPEYMQHLVRLASIALLTEVVEDFIKPTIKESQTDLTIILDAPIALDLLGCSGKALKDDILTIVNALKNIGATFIVFPASCAEMQHNLRSMLSLSVDQRHGYTHNAMVKREVDADYVTAVANNPERALHNVGITVRQIDLSTYPHSHKFFTDEQYEDFLSSVTWGNQMPAREHDSTCLALTMRLREGRHSSDIFRTRFIMVTRNPRFVQHAREYCLTSRLIGPMQEGPIVHARELATTAWLRTGLGADETIPRGHLIATCDRVLTVRPEVREALAAQLRRITPERLEQLNLLMQDARSVQKLADETLNNADVISSDNAEHLLEVMRQATAQELQEKHQAELAREREMAEAQLRMSEAAARQLQEKHAAELLIERETAEAEIRAKDDETKRLAVQIAALQSKEAHAQAVAERQIESVVGGINRRAKKAEIIVGGFLLLLGVLGLANLLTGYLTDSKIWSWVIVAGGIAGFARLWYGLMERPMPALGSALNGYCRWSSRKRLNVLGLEKQLARLQVTGGRIKVSPAAPMPELQADEDKLLK